MNFPQKPWAHQQEAELTPGAIFVYDLPENTWTLSMSPEAAALYENMSLLIDSEQHDRKASDSDIWHKLREVDSDLAVLLGRTDSDELTLQNLRTHAEQMIDSERHDWNAADSDIRHKLREIDSDLAILFGRTDSDDLTLQDLRTHAEQMIDSERHDWKAADSDLSKDLDSDILALYEADSDIRHKLREIDSDLAILFGRTDSDDLTLQDLRTHAEQMIDSERHDWQAGDSDVWHKLRELDSDIAILFGRTDSDDLTLQDLRTHAEQMVDSEELSRKSADSDLWHKLSEVDSDLAIIKDRLDSDEAQLQYIAINYVKTVNGVKPDLNNNVITSLTLVKTGPEDGRRDSPVTINRGGDIWVVSQDSDTLHDGRAYIYDSENLKWHRISGFDVAANDARYVNLSGDVMLGTLVLAGDPALPEVAANAHYVDSQDSELLKVVYKRLDSDENAIQANLSYLENRIDSEYVKNREMLVYLENLLDSEYANNAEHFARIHAYLDSEYRHRKDVDSDLRADLDSDEIAIQANLTHLENLLDSEYANNAEHFARIHAYLDSEYRHRKDVDSDIRADLDSDVAVIYERLDSETQSPHLGSFAAEPLARPTGFDLQVGDIYYDTIDSEMKVYTGIPGKLWAPINVSGSSIIVSDTAPVAPPIGTGWLDTATSGSLLIWNGSAWVIPVSNSVIPGLVTRATAEAVRLDADGNVGIGTSSPDTKFHVKTNVSDTNAIIENTTHNARLQILTTGLNKNSELWFGDGVDGSVGRVDYDHANDSMSLYTSGTEHMRLDSNGILTVPNQPSFHAIATDGLTLTLAKTNYTWTVWSTTSATHGCFDNGGNFDTATGRFTAPVSGVYSFYGNYLRKSNTASVYRGKFAVNGVGISGEKRTTEAFTGYNETGALTKNLVLNAGDFVEWVVSCDQAGETLYASGGYNWWGGHLIG